MKKKKEVSLPRLAVELPVETQKRSFALKSPSLKMLADYAQFLSAHHGAAIDEDRVLEGLISELQKDRAFHEWRSQVQKADLG